MTTNIRKALDHVRQHHPEVVKVAVFPDGRWLFVDDGHGVVAFSQNVDVSLLEDLLADEQGVDMIPDEPTVP